MKSVGTLLITAIISIILVLFIWYLTIRQQDYILSAGRHDKEHKNVVY